MWTGGAEQLRLLKNAASIQSILAELDTLVPSTSITPRRQRERYACRGVALLQYHEAGSAWQSFLVVTRDISTGGLGFLALRMLYRGTLCRLRLHDVHRHIVTLPGRIAHCRYIAGSANIYLAGLCTDEAIDVDRFLRGDKDAGAAQVGLVEPFEGDLNPGTS